MKTPGHAAGITAVTALASSLAFTAYFFCVRESRDRPDGRRFKLFGETLKGNEDQCWYMEESVYSIHRMARNT
jgi:hypothetical protein